MNEILRRQLDRLADNIDGRKQSEKILILVVVCAAIFMMWLSLAFDPLREQINSIQGQISNVTRQIEAQQTAYTAMVEASREDPTRFANERLQAIAREQALLNEQIANLAGDLVTPGEMTTILTSVLEQQSGLELVGFRNLPATPLTTGANAAVDITAGSGIAGSPQRQISGQVFEHGLVIEFQGDFFSTLKYLRYLEDITGSFFWDAISFRQLEWPNAHVRLEIHTLGMDRGFIGV